MSTRAVGQFIHLEISMDVIYTVYFHVRHGCEQEFVEIITPVMDAMRHEATFVNAVLHAHPEDSTRFMLYETWSDADDVEQVQLHRSYRQPFWSRLPHILASPREVQTWSKQRADSRFLC